MYICKVAKNTYIGNQKTTEFMFSERQTDTRQIDRQRQRHRDRQRNRKTETDRT